MAGESPWLWDLLGVVRQEIRNFRVFFAQMYFDNWIGLIELN